MQLWAMGGGCRKREVQGLTGSGAAGRAQLDLLWIPRPQNWDTLWGWVIEESPGGLMSKPHFPRNFPCIPPTANKWWSWDLNLLFFDSKALLPDFCQA